MSTRIETGTVGDDKIEAAIMGIEKLGGLTPRGNPHASWPQQADLSQDCCIWPFRSQGRGRLLPLGTADLVDDLKAALA